ncbi:hypothetical protein [Acidisphaera sp. L21]|uniref:hypothetical protein n=1 Tax=Acidisphaera sp. L21 TaxID=1641851 RepID=UPI001C20288E|nr:hypothetical protein [Acidisphaera sp. L21]
MLVLMTAILGPAITRVPQGVVQIALGTLLLLFGMRWLRKAILRAAGIIPLHDEDAAYAKESAAMRALGMRARRWDRIALATAFKITMVEGVEVVFIVVAIGGGGGGLLLPASVGALVALLLVTALGVALHRPVAMIPENTLKFAVGILVSAFGAFWIGEGLGLAWPGGDWSLLGLNAGWLMMSLLLVILCRHRSRMSPSVARSEA